MLRLGARLPDRLGARRPPALDASTCAAPTASGLGGGVYAQEVVDRFDEALDGGTEQLLDDLNLLARANMEEQVDRFVAALWADHILPEDF